MPLTKRLGLFAASVSIRARATEEAGSASAFLRTKTRPGEVAAHSVELSLGVRAIAATPLPPARVGPKPAPVNCPEAPSVPSGAQSPQGTVKEPKNSLQFARK